mgnify:CR=1 FL=1
MKYLIRGALALLFLSIACRCAGGAIRVLATTADWGALATRARRRSRRRLHRDHGDAGRASRRCEAEPGRARANGRPRRRERRRSSRSAGCRCCCRSPATRRSSAARRLLRGDVGSCSLLEVPTQPRPSHGRHPSARQPARPARSAQHRGGREGADGEAGCDRSGGRRTTTLRAAPISASAGARPSRAGRRKLRRSRTCRS